MSVFSLRQSQQAACTLGYAGLIPFLALVPAAWISSLLGFDHTRPALLAAITGYAAVILSFLGAVHWGRVISTPSEDPLGSLWLLASVLPSLIGWAGILLPGSSGIPLLLLGFLLAWDGDRRAAASGLLPAWYGTLRSRLSSVATVSLAATWPLTL